MSEHPNSPAEGEEKNEGHWQCKMELETMKFQQERHGDCPVSKSPALLFTIGFYEILMEPFIFHEFL